jgi:hypothetical protein
MIETSGTGRCRNEFEQAIAEALDQAGAGLTAFTALDAARLGKAASALIRAKRELAQFMVETAVSASEEDEEALRAELRRRIARFVEADLSGAPPEVLERIALKGSAR